MNEAPERSGEVKTYEPVNAAKLREQVGEGPDLPVTNLTSRRGPLRNPDTRGT